jgi:hypothetical protein
MKHTIMTVSPESYRSIINRKFVTICFFFLSILSFSLGTYSILTSQNGKQSDIIFLIPLILALLIIPSVLSLIFILIVNISQKQFGYVEWLLFLVCFIYIFLWLPAFQKFDWQYIDDGFLPHEPVYIQVIQLFLLIFKVLTPLWALAMLGIDHAQHYRKLEKDKL